MAEINKFLADEAKKEIEVLKKDLKELNSLLTVTAKGLNEVNKQTKTAAKDQKTLDTVTQEGNKLLAKRNSLAAKSDKKLEELTKETIKLADAEKKRIAVLKEEITGEKKAAEIKKLRADAAKRATAEAKKQTIGVKNLIKELQKEVKTEDQANASSKRLLSVRKGLSSETAKGRKQIELINKKINKNNELLTQNASKYGKLKRGIGEYERGQSKANNSIVDFGKGLLASVTGIGIAIGALKLIWKEISRTQGFQDKWNQGLNASRAAMDVLTGSVKEAISGNGGFKDFNKRLDNSITKSIELTKRTQELTRAQIGQITKLNRLALAEEIQKSIADDATLSFQKRAIANEKAQAAAIRRTDKEVELAGLLLDQNAELLQNQRDTGIKVTDEQARQNKELKVAYTNAVVARRKVDSDYSKFKRELDLDDFEQQLDFIFDVGDKRKTANEKLIADESLTAQKRLDILADTDRLLTDSFDQQIKLFESENKIQIDRNKLLTLNNKDSFEYARGLGISERATNRLLEVIRERIAATSDMDEAQKGLNESILKGRESNIEKIKIIEDESAESSLTITKEITAGRKAEYDKDVENAKIAADKKKEQIREISLLTLNSASTLADSLFEIGQNQRDIDLANTNALFQAKIEAAEGNTELQERLAAELKRRQDVLREEQFQADKNQALLKIAFNTAIGITSALTSLPPNIPLSIAVGVIGAVQAGVVASKELPAFFKGTSDTPFEYTAGEKGSELMVKKDGSLELTPDKTTHYKGKEYEHAAIIPSLPTQQLLAGRAMGGVDNRRLEGKMDILINAVRDNKSIVNLSKNMGRINRTHFNRKYNKHV